MHLLPDYRDTQYAPQIGTQQRRDESYAIANILRGLMGNSS